ncbi:MAG TPA: hypothetical protein VL326_13975 [Kofleriaceae bacterium]|nr:hypothetical protein [Kofleriaceae bacterium]
MFGYYSWFGYAIVLLQIFCVVHAVRGQRSSWIWIVLFFPLIGSLAYIVTEVRVRRGRGGRNLASQIVDVVQPSRRLEALRKEVEDIPSVQNRIALADECVRHKLYDEALQHYEAASSGVHGDDPEVLRGRATVQLEKGDAAAAKATLDKLFSGMRTRPPALRLLYARVIEANGDLDATLAAYREAIPGSIGDEARCRHALALEKAGKPDDAMTIYTKIVKDADRSTGAYRRDNRDWIRIAKQKLEQRSPQPHA